MALPALAIPAAVKIAAGALGTLAKAAKGTNAAPANQATAAITSGQTKARAVAQDFEKVFLEQMMDRMFKTEGSEGPLGDNGTGSDVYRSMLVKEYAGNITRTGGIGIADQVYREILRLQEGGARV
ncbi:rod-binding protein [Chelatococcus sp. SYSU_G07232]|uniref:Rod-binding protein n=1 Tax=Chelatococcus albus TaxID=3047466 RepID=A0ABT7AGG1_9HYPH|nr:rod-binding protein [Chelatococcus sp. SYSU_G07232]MDJ1158459.1 rod-binding protein [Chelatococcus sp. SYSU_G07232]